MKKPVVFEYDIFTKIDEFEDWDEEYSVELHEQYDDNPWVPFDLEVTQRFVRKSKSKK